MTPAEVHTLGVVILVAVLAVNELRYISRNVAARHKERIHKAHLKGG